MRKTDRKFRPLALGKSACILLALIAASSVGMPVHADAPTDNPVPLPSVASLTDSNQPAPYFTTYELPNGMQIVEARRAVASFDTPTRGPISGPSTNASASQTSGSTTAEWTNGVAYYLSPRQISHYVARTARTSGGGDYKAETHATLINGTQYDGPIWFSRDTHACAQSAVVNGTAQSCQSPFFSVPNGLAGNNWRIVSGHSLDIGNNGSWDMNCSGCIDWTFTFPS